jgi:outer membrane protein assembly factor BamA
MKLVLKARLGLVLVGLAVWLLSPTPARAEIRTPPVIVSIEGDEIPGADVVALSGLEVGQPLTGEAARQAVRNLWATGGVSDVRVLARPVAGGVAVRLQLRLSQVVRQLDLVYPGARRTPAMTRQQVARAIGYLAGMPWQPEDMERITTALRTELARRGYPDATVEGSVEAVPDTPEAVVLRLTIDQGEPVRITDLAFEGDIGLDEDEVRQELKLRAGQVFDRVVLEDGIAKVLLLYRGRGYFQVRIPLEDVREETTDGGHGRWVRVVVPIDTGPHYSVVFVNNRWFPDEDLLDLLALEEERGLTRAVIDSLAQRVRDHYRRHGFFHARVDWRVRELAPDRRQLAFRIRAGPPVRVRSIEFEGNEHFDDRHLRRQIHAELQERLGEEGLFRTVRDPEVNDLGPTGEVRESWRPGPRRRPVLRVDAEEVYDEEVYREAIAHIVELYVADGHLLARASEPRLVFSDEGRLLRVVIEVHEGPRTEIDSITFGGNEARTDAEIMQDLDLALGQHLNRFEVEQARRRAVRAYRDLGYVYCAITSEMYVSEDGVSADLRFEVVEGPLVRIGQILVRGNEDTRTSLIRDRVTLRPGAVFRPREAAEAERSLIDLGVFSTVSISLADPEQPAPVKDVVIEVAERRPQLFELRVGISTADGPRGALRYAYTNLFRYAVGLDLRAQLSYQVFFLGTPRYQQFFEELDPIDRLERLVVLGFNLPHLPRIGRLVALRFDGTHERDNDPAYAVTRNGVTFTVSGGYRRLLTGQIQTGFNYADVRVVQELPHCDTLDEEARRPGENCVYPSRLSIELARSPEGQNYFWVTRAQLALDVRDNPFNPQRGFYGAVSGEHVTSLRPIVVPVLEGECTCHCEDRSSNLIKLGLTLNGYVPLHLLDMVLALQVRFGWIFHLTDESITFPDRYFYLGGFDSMRGFPEESLGTEDTPELDHPPGGDAMLNLRGELRIPLPGSFSLGLFVDAGNLWRNRLNMFTSEWFTLRVTMGAGLRLNTPVGPLALDVGFVPWTRGDEGWWNFHFAIGLF